MSRSALIQVGAGWRNIFQRLRNKTILSMALLMNHFLSIFVLFCEVINCWVQLEHGWDGVGMGMNGQVKIWYEIDLENMPPRCLEIAFPCIWN